MTSNQSLEHQATWAARWAEQKTGWDLGRAHPRLARLLDHAVLEGGLQGGARIWVPGCGHGHEAAALAHLGNVVVACDFVEQALQSAQRLYGNQPGITWQQTDVLKADDAESGTYAAIVDRAMLCALQPENRAKYVANCAQRLQEGGLFAGILFSEVAMEQGPPFAISEEELWNLFSPGFSLVFMEICSNDDIGPPAIRSEWLSIWRKV